VNCPAATVPIGLQGAGASAAANADDPPRKTFIREPCFGRWKKSSRSEGRSCHASLLTTSVYLHVAVDDDGEVGSLFEFGR
jgi:hypothetical protein